MKSWIQPAAAGVAMPEDRAPGRLSKIRRDRKRMSRNCALLNDVRLLFNLPRLRALFGVRRVLRLSFALSKSANTQHLAQRPSNYPRLVRSHKAAFFASFDLRTTNDLSCARPVAFRRPLASVAERLAAGSH